MASEFSNCVEYGLHLSKRIYYGKGSGPAALARQMSRASEDYLPTAPMVYAVIPEPTIVDNPDVPSYQPYVQGRCVPPALIPLHMNGVAMEINCCFDTAFIGVSGTWRVHCVMAGKGCECLIAVPIGEQGSLLGVEVDVTGTSHRTELVSVEDAEAKEKLAKSGDGKFLKGRRIYTLKIPKVDGGCTLSVRMNWSQRIPYLDDLFCLSVPFNFPAYLVPPGIKIKNSQKILLHINSGISSEVVCKYTSHPMKILRREVGNLSFSNEAEVSAWSNMDFDLSYSISSSDLFGGVLLQSPSLHDFDQREMFCLYIFPGQNQNQNRKVFRKEVVFIIDISGSMKGGPLGSTKRAVLASLSKLSPEETFNIIGFNGDTKLFSSSMEQATSEAITRAAEWIDANLVANGGTNILLPMEQAIKMLAETGNSIPLIFLITDGSVDNEREICNLVKASLKSGKTISPRLCTFGIGTFCNHYFLQMLSEIGRGIYDAAYDVGSIDSRFQTLFIKASSLFLANITVDAFKDLGSLELFPTQIPDLACGSPLIISGRYNGSFPESFKVCGTSADMSTSTIHLKPQRAKELLLDRVLARRQIDIMTSHAWLLENKDLEDKVAKMSKQTGFPSEYTRLILMLNNEGKNEGKKAPPSIIVQEMLKRFELSKSNKVEWNGQKIILLGNQGVGFGNLAATAENLQPGKEIKATQAADLLVKAAANCCGRLIDRFCCLCFIKSCMYMNDSFAQEMTIRLVLVGSRFLLFFFLVAIAFSGVFASNGSRETEKTLAMIKPDGLRGNYTNRIKMAILESGFKILKERIVELDEDRASLFYAEHSSRSFFSSLVKYMTSGPVCIMVLEKQNAIADWRAMIGPTDATKAKATHPNSIRAMCGLDSQKNCVHGSDSHQSAQREISFFFEEEIGEMVGIHDEL